MLIWHWILTPIVACHLVVRPWWATRMQGWCLFGGLVTVHPPCVLRPVLSFV